MSWIKHEHPHYRRNRHKWVYATDHFAGTVLDELTQGIAGSVEEAFLKAGLGNAQDPTTNRYLHQRLQGESDEAYRERQMIADYTPDYTSAVITLAGMLHMVDKDKSATWDQSEMGSPDDPDSIMHSLYQDADGMGTNWPIVFSTASSDIITTIELWGIVEGVRRGRDGAALNRGSVRFILPQDVPDWIEDSDGNIVQVKVRDTGSDRQSLTDEPETYDVYYIYTVEGYQRWRVRDGKEEPIDPDVVPYGGDRNVDFRFYNNADMTIAAERVPVFRCVLPLRANIGYIMARKANAIYNMENALDFQLWSTCFPKAMLDVVLPDGSINTELYEELSGAIRKGSNAWAGEGHKFKGPPVDGAEMRGQRIDAKRQEFMRTFFQVAGDQARERTATEIRHDFRAGVEAFLGLLSECMDEMENEALFLLEQVNFPGEPARWGKTTVKRSTDFSSVDLDGDIDRAIGRWTPSGTLPVTEEIVYSLALRAAERDRIPLDDEQKERLREASGAMVQNGTQATDIMGALRNRRFSGAANGN